MKNTRLTAVLAASRLPALWLRKRSRRPNSERRPPRSRYEKELATPRPIAAADSVWIEDLTYLEVRDAIKAGKTTA